MTKIPFLLLLAALLAMGSCQSPAGQPADLPGSYPIQPVDIRQVHLSDSFWLPVIERVQAITIDYALEKCRQEGRMDNFLLAAGKLEGPARGAMPFDDTDLYKIIEGASSSLISAPNPELARRLDTLISIIALGQEPDGYLTTWRTIDPARPPAPWVKVIEGKRWESLESSHELYNAGHLYEAAYQHFAATGQRNFLDIALKNADLVVRTFGNNPDQLHKVPGHQIIETGLIKLYQATGRQEYLSLARYFLDHRGDSSHHALYGPYSQDHQLVVDQEEVVGHAVRAVYMYAAMTDIAALQQDSAYRRAVDALWHNMVEKKMYLTGGIGSRHEGEAFGENYELPNLTGYAETCAAIGSVYWNHRLHRLGGEGRYFDVIERTLYNGLLSGLSLDGKQFFYPNALESDGQYRFNMGQCTRQGWFDCSCCPTNLIRFLPRVPELLYSQAGDTLWVNLFASSRATVAIASQTLEISQETRYPWSGQVVIRVKGTKRSPATLRVRVPGWAQGEVLPGDLYRYSSARQGRISLLLDGEEQEIDIRNGYLSLSGQWEGDHELVLSLPMTVRQVEAHSLVADNRGKRALEYGPLVYAVEKADAGSAWEELSLREGEACDVVWKPDLLGGVNTIGWGPYRAIPYYAWSNRGVNPMKVWLPLREQS